MLREVRETVQDMRHEFEAMRLSHAAELVALRDEMRLRQADEISALRDELESLRDDNGPADKRGEAGPEGANAGEEFSKPLSLYAYCVERLGQPLSTLELLLNLVLLLVLTIFQLVLAFAFFDATWFTAAAGKSLPAYADPVRACASMKKPCAPHALAS
jgi:hypothetical protein